MKRSEEFLVELSNFLTNEKTQEDIKNATEIANEAVKSYPKNVDLWIARGRVLLYENSYDLKDSEDSYKKAIQLEPTNYLGYEYLADHYDSILDTPENAIELYEQSLNKGGGAETYLGLARSLAQTGQKDKASNLLKKGVKELRGAQDSSSLKKLKTEIEQGDWDH